MSLSICNSCDDAKENDILTSGCEGLVGPTYDASCFFMEFSEHAGKWTRAKILKILLMMPLK